MIQVLEDHELRLTELEQLVHELEEALKRVAIPGAVGTPPSIDFSGKCVQCGRSILWARTTKNDRPVALDSRPGPYVLTSDGKADYQHAGGYACHYDKTPEGCQSEVKQAAREQEEPVYREWQDIYDR